MEVERSNNNNEGEEKERIQERNLVKVADIKNK